MKSSFLSILIASVSCAAATAQTQSFKYTASDASTAGPAAFGHAVGMDDDYVVIGSRNALIGGVDIGAAYVYDRNTGVELYQITPPDGASDNKFGFAVAVQNGIAFIGSPHHDVAGTENGEVYIYDLSTGLEIGRLAPTVLADDGHFGIGVDVEGNIAVVGAFTRSPLGTDSGEVFVFDWTTGTQLHALTASDGAAGDKLGWTVAIDGGKILAGADFDGDLGVESGSAYIFDAATGAELHKLLPSDGATGDHFGWKLDMENGLAVVGSQYHDLVGAQDAGAVYAFDVATGNQLAKYTAPDASAADEFGFSVDLDGTRLVVGAPYQDSADANAGAVYVLDAATGALEIKWLAGDAEASDLFGASVLLDGDTMIVGSTFDDDITINAGSAYQIELGSCIVKYCTVATGSTNNTSVLDASGPFLSSAITLDLSNGPAGEFTYLLIGSGSSVVSNPAGAQGDLCILGGSLGRYVLDFGPISGSGTFSTDISNSASGGPGFGIPNSGGAAILTGETWNFQYWHRNPGGAPSGFSEAVSVTFK